MKFTRLLSALGILFYLSISVSPLHAIVVTAPSCSSTDVSNALLHGYGVSPFTSGSPLIDGDTLILPTCNSLTGTPGTGNDWNSTLTVSNAINIIGQGAGNTIIIDDVVRGGSCGANGNPLIYVNNTGSGTTGWSIGNFSIQGSALDNSSCSEHIKVTTYSHAMRIHHMVINGTTAGIQLDGDVWGVIDNNTFYGTSSIGVKVHENSWQQVGLNGDNSWAAPDTLGAPGTVANSTASWAGVYVENNTFNIIKNGGAADVGCDAYGSRVVIRHNTMSILGSHGTDTTFNKRSCRHAEVYNNTVSDTRGAVGTVNTSGTAVTFVSGAPFNVTWIGTITINSVPYTISTVNSAKSITLTTSAGTQIGVSYSVLNSVTLSQFFLLRGGTALEYNNSFTTANGSYTGNLVLTNFRDKDGWPPFGPSTQSWAGAGDGTGPFDNNDGVTYYSDIAATGSTTDNIISSAASAYPGTGTGSLSPPWTANQLVGYSLRDLTTQTGSPLHLWGSIITANTVCSAGTPTCTITTGSDSQGGQTHTVTVGDSYAIYKVTASLDQPGRGQGTYLSGSTPSSCASCSPASGWLNEVIDPIYAWGNTVGGTETTAIGTSPNISGGIGGHIQSGREYYDWNSGYAGGSTLSSGVAHGSLTLSQLQATITTCSAGLGGNTPGVAYWSSTDNALYDCNPANTWGVYYKPYIYPHPLQGLGPFSTLSNVNLSGSAR